MTCPVITLEPKNIDSVLNQFVAARAVQSVVPLGNRGGFSGARLWQVRSLAGSFCLRCWPATASICSERLSNIHGWMTAARAHDLKFVPVVYSTHEQKTWVTAEGRLWDLTEWMPGKADFREQPTTKRLQAACRALARLHQAWTEQGAEAASCPALIRRFQCLKQWHDVVQSGWQPDFDSRDAVISSLSRNAWRLLQENLPTLPSMLFPWQSRPVRAQPCLCDIWHDHVLFQEDILTGIIDYGSMKMDHVAVDIARLLGSLVGNDEENWRIGVNAYREIRAFSEEEEQLARALDRSGTLLAIANWLRWLFYERRQFEDLELVAQRVRSILERVERW